MSASGWQQKQDFKLCFDTPVGSPCHALALNNVTSFDQHGATWSRVMGPRGAGNDACRSEHGRGGGVGGPRRHGSRQWVAAGGRGAGRKVERNERGSSVASFEGLPPAHAQPEQ